MQLGTENLANSGRYICHIFFKLRGCKTLMGFFIQDLHLNFHSFLGFQHRSGSSVKAIMLLSTALPLAIGLNLFGL